MGLFDNLIPLFNSGQWTLHANAVSSPDGKTLTLNATGSAQQSYVTVPVVPWTLYDIAITTGAQYAVYAMSVGGGNNTPILSYVQGASTRRFSSGRETSVRVWLSNEAQGAGVFTSSDLKLVRAMPSLYDELIVNGRFAGGSGAGWVSNLAGKLITENGDTFCRQGYAWDAWQTISVAAGTVLTFKATIRAGTAATGARITCSPMRGAVEDSSRAGAPISVTTPTADWKEYTAQYTVPVGYGYDGLRVYMVTNGGGGYHDFDNISIKRTVPKPPGTNLIPLFNDPAWVKHANAQASADGTSLTLNATGAFQSTTVDIPITPNTIFKAVCTMTESVLGSGQIGLYELDAAGNTIGPSRTLLKADGTRSGQDTTGPRTARLRIYPTSADVGTFTFSNLKLVQVLPTINPANIKDPTAELVVHGDFSSDLSGWLQSAVNGGSIVWANRRAVLTSTGTPGSNAIGVYLHRTVPAAPNALYTLKANIQILSGNGGGGVSLRVRWLAASGATLSYGGNFVAVGSGDVSIDVQVPAGMSTAEIECLARGDQVISFGSLSLKRKSVV